jgi:hypothetical protein
MYVRLLPKQQNRINMIVTHWSPSASSNASIEILTRPIQKKKKIKRKTKRENKTFTIFGIIILIRLFFWGVVLFCWKSKEYVSEKRVMKIILPIAVSG